MTSGRRVAISTTRAVISTKGRTVGAQLHIKSEDAYRLASRLSELTDESLTRLQCHVLQRRRVGST